MDDLLQEGRIALLEAIDGYDSSKKVSIDDSDSSKKVKKVRFRSYAYPGISGAMIDCLRNTKGVHISRTLWDLTREVRAMIASLKVELGREPGLQEIADSLKKTPEQIIDALRIMNMEVMGVQCLYDDMVQEQPELVEIESYEILSGCLEKLKQKHDILWQVINRFYWHELSIKQIACDLGISEKAVRKRLFDARKKLRECIVK